MNRDQFEKAMDGLDEKFVAEAADYKKSALKGRIIKIGSLAACAVLVMAGVLGMITGRKTGDAAGDYYYWEGKEQSQNEAAAPAEDSPQGSFDIEGNKSLAPDREGLVRNNAGQKGTDMDQHTGKKGNTVNDPSKIIYTARLTLESQETDKCLAQAEKIFNEMG